MTAITNDDVRAIVKALLAQVRIPGPRLRRPSDELLTWFALCVHPDDEPRMSAKVAADPCLQALVTVVATEGTKRGFAYLVDQDKALKIPDHHEYRIPIPRPMPSWLRDSYYLLPPKSPGFPFLGVTL